MPRVVLTECERRSNEVSGVLAKYQAIYKRECRDVAKALGITTETYRLHRKDPDKFTAKEIRALIKTLRIPKEEILSILI